MATLAHNTLIITKQEEHEHVKPYLKHLIDNDETAALDAEIIEGHLERQDDEFVIKVDKVSVTPGKGITESRLIEWLTLIAPIVGDSDYAAFPLENRHVVVYRYTEGRLQYATVNMAHTEFTIVDPEGTES